ncbi:MAG: matrixin family metalloprotease [Acidimicrobiales bacterium]
MAVSFALRAARLDAPAGGTVTGEATVRNEGDEAVSARLDLDGEAAAWSWILPTDVTLAPGGEAGVRFGFRLPAGSKPAAGSLPWALRARSAPPASEVLAVAAGTLEVAPFTELSVGVSPVASAGKGPVTHEVSVLNRGNARATTSLAATAGDGSLELVVEPSTVVAEPGRQAAATLTVRPRERLVAGAPRSRPFTVSATPEGGGTASTASGSFRQAPTLAPGALKALVGLVVLALVGGVLWATVLSGGGSKPASTDAAAPVAAGGTLATDPACPAKGHLDTRANGLRPQDIPTLPDSYSFSQTAADGCTPVRWNPCDPVHYVLNSADAPPTGVADVHEAFARLGQATGMAFVDDGTTDETIRSRSPRATPFFPDRYGQRWAPVLVEWTHLGSNGNIQIVGTGLPNRVGDLLVSGTLTLNVDAVTDAAKRTPIEGGFGPAAGGGVGAIGPEGVTWGRIILHELSHVVGLGHSRDRASLMYPETTSQTSRPVKFGEADLEGLKLLGRPAGCLPTPPLPTS